MIKRLRRQKARVRSNNGGWIGTLHTRGSWRLDRKRSRARVPIAGQCVFLQNSLRIKMFDFFLNSQNYRINHIFY